MKSGTPLIVDTSVATFEKYIASLSAHARKDWTYTRKHNADLVYEEVPYSPPEVEKYMNIWGQQIIHGNEEVRWGFGIGHVTELFEKGVLRVFRAKQGDEVKSMHFVELHVDYIEAHPPMYDKKKDSKRYMAKFMWFNLIKWAIEHNVHWVDLGSGDRGTWKELVTNREQYKRIAYKWLYIAEETKKHPEREQPYFVYEHGGKKWISANHSNPTQDLLSP
jgi:hypothetical protein